MPYKITSPHPTALPNRTIHTGRGGYGNTIKIPSSSSSSSSSSPTSSSSLSPNTTPRPSNSLRRVSSVTASSIAPSYLSTSSRYTSTGRGGYGNILYGASLPPPSGISSLAALEHELDLRAAREMGREMWHTGRGGAGNTNVNGIKTPRKRKSKMRVSDDSEGSGRSSTGTGNARFAQRESASLSSPLS